jgi:hypothetical protein
MQYCSCEFLSKMEAPENGATIVDTQEGAAKLIAESAATLAEAFLDTLKHQVECEFICCILRF